MPNYQICAAFYSYRDGLPENLSEKTIAQEYIKSTLGFHSCIARKRLC